MHSPKSLISYHPKLFCDIPRALHGSKVFVLGFPNSFLTFPMADPDAHFRNVLGPWLKNAGSEILNIYFQHFSALSLAQKCVVPILRFPKTHCEISWALDRICWVLKLSTCVFAFLYLTANLPCLKRAFSKHVDIYPFFWLQGLAVLTISICFVCFLWSRDCGESFSLCPRPLLSSLEMLILRRSIG